MKELSDRTHRLAMYLTVLTAGVLGVLAIVLGIPDDASGRGEPAVGNGEGQVDLITVGGAGAFDAPVSAAFAPGQDSDVYVVGQGGEVFLVDDGVLQSEPFLDITDLTNNSGEQGLLGLAFHPDYTGSLLYVYAYYNDKDNGDVVVSEFEATPTDADESSKRNVIRIKHRFAGNHNGGTVRFGPDGFMYMATGDGGDGGDPRELAQDKDSLLGKLIRLDATPEAAEPYSIPNSNPYVGKKGKDEIFAIGLRNPFRFNFDPDTQRILIGDVGQGRYEEVDIESAQSAKGANFGWDRWEGFKRYRDSGKDVAAGPSKRNHDKPVLAYGRSKGRSVVGGLVVRDESLTNLYGRYLFTDFFTDRLRSLVPKLSKVKGFKELDGPTVSAISSFTEDPTTREVYITSLGDGSLYRIEPD